MDPHKIYMRLAIELAKKALGATNPNPMVGACVVKGGRVLGAGYHRKAGLSHAEVNALKSAGKMSGGATLYVTLEPCDHYGRTPPCTDAIIESGIKRVVIGMKDPNPINNGRGIRRLRRRGIEVLVGVLEGEVRSINRPYIKFVTRRLPFVTLKLAQSLDGKIATHTGDSRWITGKDSRRYVHALRGEVDAVMVGVGTVLRDDPRLTVRTRRVQRKKITRIIVDSHLRTPLKARIFKDKDRAPVLIAAREGAGASRRKALEKKGAEVVITRPKDGRVDLKDLLRRLALRGIMHVLVEGGGELAAGILKERLADRMLLFIAPKIIGGRDAVTSVEGGGAGLVSGAIRILNLNVKRFSEDILIEGDVS